MSDDIVGFVTARKTSRCELVAGWLDGGTLKLYNGTRPGTNGGAITDQDLLVTFTLPDPSGTVSAGVFTANAIDDGLVLASGTAAWARAFDDGDGIIADFDVGLTDSDAAVWLDNLTLVVGALITVVSFAITEG